tara:strand:+ start:540 stop:833 length:294 start_codon:yes stop_codon:yes gene_type:complete
MFSNHQQKRDWLTLWKQIDESESVISCTNYPEIFFPEGADWSYIKQAKTLCGTCPLIRECATYALKWETEGVWGGLSAGERAKMRSVHLRRRTITNL